MSQQSKHRLSLLTTQSQIVQESKVTILMAKVKELYEKLAQQISQNQTLLQENQKLKLALSTIESKQLHQSQTSVDSTLPTSPIFNLFIDKISLLENENKKLKEEKQRNNTNLSQLYLESISQGQNQGQNLGGISKRNASINEKYMMMTPQVSTSCFSGDENVNIMTLGGQSGCYSPRYSVNMSKRMSGRERVGNGDGEMIDRLWLSPNRKNLQKLIGASKNR